MCCTYKGIEIGIRGVRIGNMDQPNILVPLGENNKWRLNYIEDIVFFSQQYASAA